MQIDLHRHAGGAISPETIWKLIQQDPHLSNLAPSVERLHELMTFKDDTEFNFHRFLAKFRVLDNIRWTEDSIDITIEQIVRDLRDEGIHYCELRFSVNKYLSYIDWDQFEACLFFLDRLKHWSDAYKVNIGPVLAIKYESPKQESRSMSKLINHWKIAERLVGIDTVGNESMFDHRFLGEIYRFWRMCGKGILIHAAESQGAQNARLAIEHLKPNRIMHGNRIAKEDPDLLKIANDNGVAFDVAVTSNLKTGVVKSLQEHPLPFMVKAGCAVTIGTDDPVTLNTTLKKEYDIAAGVLNTTFESDIMRKIIKNSEDHAIVKRSAWQYHR
jgi:aminodeoxyfutalosine deaminase